MPRKRPGEYQIPKEHAGAIRYAKAQLQARDAELGESAAFVAFARSKEDYNTLLATVAEEMKCNRPGISLKEVGDRFYFVENGAKVEAVGGPAEEPDEGPDDDDDADEEPEDTESAVPAGSD